MTAAEIRTTIHARRLKLCELVHEQTRRYDEERERQIARLNAEIHDLKAELFQVWQVQSKTQSERELLDRAWVQ